MDLSTLHSRHVARLEDAERKRFGQTIAAKMDQVLLLLQEEEQAAQHWLELLDGLLERASRQLRQQQQSHFDEESRRYMQVEIRKIFAKYDLLAKPRRLTNQLERICTWGTKVDAANPTFNRAYIR